MDLFAMTFLGYTFAAIWLIPFIFIWILIAFLPANIASNKGRSFFLYFILSLFFWWITLFVVLLMPDKSGGSQTPPAATPPAAE